MGIRRKAREIVIQVLYQIEVQGDRTGQSVPLFFHEFQGSVEVSGFAQELLSGIQKHYLEIDDAIGRTTVNWRIDRIDLVDLCILRLAVYEILFESAIPLKVSINEALEIAKRFSSRNAVKFINGILDNIAPKVGRKELSPGSDNSSE